MYGVYGPDTFWLNFINIALGLVTLACALVIAGGVVRELLTGRERRVAVGGDDHAFDTPRLGLTMADGGERIDSKPPTPPKGH